MDFDEVMRELERLGTEQNRKVYRRHGAGDVLFGVSFAHLYALQKRIKRDHELAEELWATGNADARTLAAMIADPARFTMAQLDGWLDGVRYPVLLDLVVKNVALRSPLARDAMERWIRSADEWIGRAGWSLLGLLAAEDPALPDALFEARLAEIEASIHRAKNRTREAMNTALIQIGARNEALRGKALTAARRIGKVEVDHGDTSCKTPDAGPYIEKIWARKQPAVKSAGKAAAPAAKTRASERNAAKAAKASATKAAKAPAAKAPAAKAASARRG